jgi:hypothetical protein
MKLRKGLLLCLLIVIILQSCLQCITGGNLHVKKRFVSNVCGLANGVYVREIKVDNFNDRLPVKYSILRSASLYREGRKPGVDPKRLYYKDCKRFFNWFNDRITDTVAAPLDFRKNNWYIFSSSDANTDIFMFVDERGKRHLIEKSGKADLINF